MHAFRPCPRLVVGLFVGFGLWPAVAPAQVPLALPALEACDGQTETDITQTPLGAQDPAVTRLLQAIQQTFDTALAENILKAVPMPTPLADAKAKRSQAATLTVKNQANATAGQTLAALANPTFGARDRMAVSIHPQLVASGALNTDIRLIHQTGALDTGFDLAARQSLVTADPMALSYEGRALINLGQTMQFGVAAKGSLGTPGAPGLAGTERAGPTLHFNLKDRNLSLSSDLGYDFGLNPLSAIAGPQFRAKLDLRLSL